MDDPTWRVSTTERRLDSNPTVRSSNSNFEVIGIRVEHADREPTFGDDGIPLLLAQSHATLRLFGSGFNNDTRVTFTTKAAAKQERCEFPVEEGFTVDADTLTEHSVSVKILVPPVHPFGSEYFLCIKDGSSSYIHQVRSLSWINTRVG